MSSGPPPVPGGRSSEEREAAHRERMARRTATTDWMAEAGRLTEPEPPTVADLEAALPPRRRRGPRWGRIAAVGVLAVVLLAIGWFCVSLFQPFGGDGEGSVRVTIPAGFEPRRDRRPARAAGRRLQRVLLRLRARIAGRSDQLKPGSYALKRDMSFTAALDALEQGVPPDVVQVTIPEGRSRREIAASVKGQLRGQLPAREPALAAAGAAALRRPGQREPRGLPVSRHLRAQARQGRTGAGGRAAAHLQAPSSRGSTCATRARRTSRPTTC